MSLALGTSFARLNAGSASVKRMFRGSAGVWNADAADWIKRVEANSGSVSTATANAVTTFCNAIDAAGIRDKFYRLNLFCGTGLNACLVPLYRGPSLSGTQYGNTTDTNNGPFVSDDYVETGASGGLLGNGSSKYLDTGLSPSDYQANASTGHISAYHSQPTGTNVNRTVIACNNAASGLRFWIVSDIFSTSSVAAMYGATRSAPQTLGSQVGAPAGHRLVSRTASNSLTHYLDAVSVGTDSLDISFSNEAIADDFYILARNDNGTADRFGNSRVMAYSIGEGITSQQASDYYNAVQTFQTSLGRNL